MDVLAYLLVKRRAGGHVERAARSVLERSRRRAGHDLQAGGADTTHSGRRQKKPGLHRNHRPARLSDRRTGARDGRFARPGGFAAAGCSGDYATCSIPPSRKRPVSTPGISVALSPDGSALAYVGGCAEGIADLDPPARPARCGTVERHVGCLASLLLPGRQLGGIRGRAAVR